MSNYGDYNFGENIRLSNNGSFYDRYHEVTHLMLTKASFWGLSITLLTKIAGSDCQELLNLLKVMKDACEETYESYALVGQYIYALTEKDVAEQNRIKKSMYYQVYNKDFFAMIEGLTFDQIKTTFIHSRIALLALGVKLNSIQSADEYQEYLILNPASHPDARFRSLIRAYNSLSKEMDIEDITNEVLLTRSGLNAVLQESVHLFEYLNELKYLLLEEYGSDVKMKTRIHNIKLEIGDKDLKSTLLERYTEIGIPMADESSYSTEYPEELLSWHLELNVMVVLLDSVDEGVHQIFFYMTEFKRRFGFFSNTPDAECVMSLFQGEIIFFYEDYEKSQLFKNLQEKRVFYCFSERYSEFKKILSKAADEKKEAYLHQINEAFYALFVKGKGEAVLFTHQLRVLVPNIFDDIERQYYHYIDCDENNVDGVFYRTGKDWGRYADVLMAISMSTDNGGRIPRSGFK